MLAIAGILFLGLSVLRFFWTLRRGIYRRYPYEQFAILGTAAGLGLAAAVARPGVLTILLFLVELVAFAAVLFYFGVGLHFPREAAGIKVGERFPDVTLPDSEGRIFDSRALLGTATVLYYFYRGHF